MSGLENHPAPENSNLRRSVGFWGVFGQSVAGVSPTTTPTINIALIFAVAGAGSWAAYLIATVAILLVALNLAGFARVFASAGSLSDFVGHGLGPVWRLVTAWVLLLAYLGFSAATLAGCAGYVSTLFGWAHVSLPILAWVALLGVAASVFALRDIRMSTGLMLGLEIFSVCLVLLLGLAILVRQGITVDLSELHLDGKHRADVGNALLIGVLSFVGFEAAGTLGDEARKPLVDIPRALILTPILTGLFFIFAAYVIVLGFNRYHIDVAASNAPLDDLARALHFPGLGIMVAVGAAISLFGSGIAMMVASSRLILALARLGAMPALLAKVSGRQSAPMHAVALVVVITLVTGLALAVVGKPLDIYDWLGTFGTFGCVIAYALTCIAAPVFLRRAAQLRAHHVVTSVTALAVLGYVLFASVYPVPAPPMNYLPWLFLGLLAAGMIYSLARLRQSGLPWRRESKN